MDSDSRNLLVRIMRVETSHPVRRLIGDLIAAIQDSSAPVPEPVRNTINVTIIADQVATHGGSVINAPAHCARCATCQRRPTCAGHTRT